MLFGQSQQPQQTTSLFGGGATGQNPAFGQPQQQSPAPSLFGGQQQQQPQTSLFGGQAQHQAQNSPFGAQTQQAPQISHFGGQPQQQQQQTTSLFGGQPQVGGGTSLFNPVSQPTNPTNPQAYPGSAPSTQLPIIDGQQVYPHHGDQIKGCLQLSNQLRQDQNMSILMFLIDSQVDQSIKTAQQAFKYDQVSPQNQPSQLQALMYINDRSLKVKVRSVTLMTKLLNLREKLVSQTYMYKTKNQQKQSELAQLTQKIRDVKCRVGLKYNRLRGSRMELDAQDCKPENKRAHKSTGINVSLTELKKAMETLERQTLRLQREFNVVLNYCHGVTPL